MAKIPIRVKNTINKYITALKEHNIPIKHVILFGSYANGNYDDRSDIDLAIVSDLFVGDRITDRSRVRAITLSVSSDLEVLPYNTKEFTTDDPFVKEILETGLRIV